MSTQVLRGSKQEIAEGILQIPGQVNEVIVYVDEPVETMSPPDPGEDIFAEMEPYMVHVGDADCSREAVYTRMVGE